MISSSISICLCLLGLNQADKTADDILVAGLREQVEVLLRDESLHDDRRQLLGSIRENLAKLAELGEGTSDAMPTVYKHVLSSHLKLLSDPGTSLKQLTAIDDDLRIKLGHAMRERRSVELPSEGQNIHALAFSPKSDYVVAGNNLGEVIGWEPDGPQNPWRVRVGTRSVASLSPGKQADSYVALNSDGSAALVKEDRNVLSFARPQNITGDPMSVSGETATSSSADGLLWMWDVRNPLSSIFGFNVSAHHQPLRSVSNSESGQFFSLVTGEGDLSVWQASGQKQTTLARGNIDKALLLPDEETVFSVNDTGGCSLWDWRDGTEKHNWKPHQGGVEWLRVADRGNLLITGSTSKQGSEVSYWSPYSTNQLRTVTFSKQITALSVSADGDKLAVAEASGVLKYIEWLWSKNPYALVETTANAFKNGQKQDGYTIYYVPKSHEDDEDEVRHFQDPTKDAVSDLAAGNYTMWAKFAGTLATLRENVTVDSKHQKVGLAILK